MADLLKTLGPLSVLNTGGKRIDQMKFPSDLGSDPFHHWIHFAINVQEASKATGGQSQFKTGGQGISSIVDSISSAVQATFIRKTNRIVAGIDLYMPGTMQFVQNNQYADTSLTQQLGVIGQGVQFTQQDGSSTSSVPGATELITRLTGLGEQQPLALYALGGVALNPQFEVLFTQTDLRTFQFDFLLTPRSEVEQSNIAQIIGMFRYHAAPELYGGSDARYLVPPSTFDISFHFKGAEQRGIPKIASCVCTQVSVDYVPNSVWSTFRTGYPTAARITLAFKELELIHKAKVEQGY